MQRRHVWVLTTAILVAGAPQAAAQPAPWADRVFANINFGGQLGSEDHVQTSTFTLYDEPATVSSRRKIDGGFLFDVVVGRAIRKNFGGAIGFTRRQKDSGASVEGSLPDPIFFDRLRSATAQLGGLRHSENWLTLNAVWFRPLDELYENLELMVMGGPAIVWVENAHIGDVVVSESPAGPVVDVSVANRKKTSAGIAIGADVRYLLYREQIGVGAFVRFTRATADFGDGGELTLGGFQIGGGVRIRY